MTTQGDLELNMTAQSTEFTQGGSSHKATNTYFREKINVAADGYIYHPRFQLFLVKVSGGLNQGTFGGAVRAPAGGATADGTERTSSTTAEYELRTVFLPEHPYNLELFALHREPANPGLYWQGQTATSYEQGAIFRYRSKPWFFHTSLTDLTLDSPANRTETQTYQVSGSYAGKSVSHSASYIRNDSDTSQNLHIDREKYGYGNAVRFAGISLDSRVDGTSVDQQRPLSPGYQTRQFNWTEQLAAPLPGNFSSRFDFRYMSETDRTGADAFGQPGAEVFNRTASTTFTLEHHLYQSLVSHVTLNNVDLATSSGDTTNRSGSFISNYTKAIPAGRLSAGIQFGRMEQERQGSPLIINEVHGAPLLGTFSLNQQNIVDGTIAVQVKDPPTGSLMTLPQTNYLILLTGTTVQITILSVAPATPQPDPAYVYEFQVSYALLNQSRIDTVFRGFSVRTDLWDNLFSPYFSYFNSEQEVVSGSIMGGSDQYTNEIVGVATQAGSYSGLVEHQSYRSRLNPSESLRARGQYRSPVTDDTNVSVILSYTLTDHFVSAATPGSTAYRDTTMGMDVLTDMKFRPQFVNLFLSGSYYRYNGPVDSTTLMLNSYVTWQIGMLSVNGGIQVSRLETRLSTGDVTYETQYYYATVNRRLF